MASAKTDNWHSKFGFIMAAVGSAVGLGNLWRFPAAAGENGGAAFILIYIVCVIVFGLPVLMAEYAVGRHGDRSSVSGIGYISKKYGLSPLWSIAGVIGAVTSLAIVSFYVIVSSWVFAYIPQAASGAFVGQDAAWAEANFQSILARPWHVAIFLAVFIFAMCAVVARGVSKGIEFVATVLMPAFFIMLLGLVVFGLWKGDAAKAASFILTPDFSKVSWDLVLSAVGQAFFSLGVGSCLMVTYGAYLKRDTDIASSSGLIATSDTLVALVAGFAIFPIVFGVGLSENSGPGLFFETMPIAFGQMGNIGIFLGVVFFTLALFAAFTSAISLFEVGVSWAEEWPGINRVMASFGLGSILFVTGLGYLFYGQWIDHIDLITGNVLLPLGGILIAIFAGWSMPKLELASELGNGLVFGAVRFALRYVIPPALSVILVMGIIGDWAKFQAIFGG